MDHSAKISKGTGCFHINLDGDNIHAWIIIRSDEKIDTLTIWAKDVISFIGSINVNFGQEPGLPFVY